MREEAKESFTKWALMEEIFLVKKVQGGLRKRGIEMQFFLKMADAYSRCNHLKKSELMVN